MSDKEQATSEIQPNYDEKTESFDAMNLRPQLSKGIISVNFILPTEIQQKVIVPIITSCDVIVQSPAGKNSNHIRRLRLQKLGLHMIYRHRKIISHRNCRLTKDRFQSQHLPNAHSLVHP
jgi:hypothetical protein